ncbi:PLP-dependent aminotransferase family protein [Modicisalibacter sp. 'Wilcox']|uniref:aminotransferase-like domain-containing protein n=1 Tax=Modicisalibacter sp. 'Wilcox' TaxID=2679914 RepID=UPI0013D429BC|nr:PLP-dependent aminotransferase family protein [Modicisalibacter sp. 'Wilcox']
MATQDARLSALWAAYQRQPESLGKQVRVEQALRGVIHSHWPGGVRLPSQRRICARLGLARGTLVKALQRLIDEGLLVTGQGSGTWVCRPCQAPVAPLAEAALSRSGEAALSARARAVLASPGASSIQSGAFMPGIPDIAHFPMRKWRSLYASVTVPQNTLLLSYSTGGYGPLKRAIRDFLQRWRGIRCDTDQIIITEGAHHGIELCTLALADAGQRVLLDSPCYWGARNVFMAAGLEVETLAWHPESGYVPRTASQPVHLAYFTGSHHYPLGVPTRTADKRALCREVGASFVIEDDYEFADDGGSDLLFDPQGSAGVLVGTFSKLLFPGLRLGYLVVPRGLADPLNRLRSEVFREGRMMDQAVLAQFIDDGDLDAWNRRIRRDYLARQQVLHDRLYDLPGVRRLSAPSGTISLCLELDPEIDDVALTQRLLEAQLVVRPLSLACGRDDPRRGLVMGIGMVSGDGLRHEADRLRRALKRHLKASRRRGARHAAPR